MEMALVMEDARRTMNQPSIAVLLPCHNEEHAIGDVVRDFSTALPGAAIYDFDNNSTGATVAEALATGAIVRHEMIRGKGRVVRRMFRDIDADLNVIADGDSTYDVTLAPSLIARALSGPFDLVNCVRVDTEKAAYRSGHRLGNHLLTGTVRMTFGDRVRDMLSGYKVLSYRLVKSFPALSIGFDIKTELAMHALELAMPITHEEGVSRAARGLEFQAPNLSRRMADLQSDHQTYASRTPASVLWSDRGNSRRARASVANRRSGHRHRAGRHVTSDNRIHSRYGNARPGRDAASRLPCTKCAVFAGSPCEQYALSRGTPIAFSMNAT